MYGLIWLFAYFIGSIPTAIMVSKYVFGVDIRDHGSQNPGATNSLRVLGKKAASFVLLVDMGKGMLAALLPTLFKLEIDPLTIGLVAVIGHCFPIFAGFRGGKAIATTAGVLLVVNPWLFLATYSIFFLIILLTKYIFAGSLSVGITLLLYSLIEAESGNPFLFFFFVIFLIFLHRSNIQNFINQREPKINDKKHKKDRVPPKGGVFRM